MQSSYLCSMKPKSTEYTKQKRHLGQIARVLSGVYIKGTPAGEIAYLQVKDLQMESPDTTATHIEYTPKLEDYILHKGDLLFAGKGLAYLCQVFNLNIRAVASTALFTIRLHSDVLSPEYLCWYLNHPKVVATIKTAQAGSGTPLIHKPTLENLEIVIPSHEVQKRIVELSELQKREEHLLKEIAEKRVQIMNQILINEVYK